VNKERIWKSDASRLTLPLYYALFMVTLGAKLKFRSQRLLFTDILILQNEEQRRWESYVCQLAI
jgi:hypothetical protein